MTYCRPEAVFLRGLFASLSETGIRFAVMCNHHSLPDCAGGSDLDILISPTDAGRAQAAILAAIEQADAVPIGISRSVGFFQVHALGAKACMDELEWWGLRVDFYCGEFSRGWTLLDVNVPWPVQYHRGIPVLSVGLAGVLGVLKGVLCNNVLSPRYAPAARSAAASDWPQITALLAPMGAPALVLLRGMLLSTMQPAEVGEASARLRHALFLHAAAREGKWRSCWLRLEYQQTNLKRYLQPSGLVLAFLGVDGSGKSTVINAILPALNAATHNSVTVRHLRPTVLPPLARFKCNKSQLTGPVLEPHGSPPSGMLGSLLRLAYLSADYALGYWLWTRPKIASLPAVVVFDRYAYDMAIDQRRFRIALPACLVAWFAALAPKPDLIICLHGDAETIASRKGELTLAETQRQVAALSAFAAREPRAVLVSTDTDIVQTRDAVLGAICTCLRVRSKAKP